jgi:hypothetical protein
MEYTRHREQVAIEPNRSHQVARVVKQAFVLGHLRGIPSAMRGRLAAKRYRAR